jgi:hypothetical protein
MIVVLAEWLAFVLCILLAALCCRLLRFEPDRLLSRPDDHERR